MYIRATCACQWSDELWKVSEVGFYPKFEEKTLLSGLRIFLQRSRQHFRKKEKGGLLIILRNILKPYRKSGLVNTFSKISRNTDLPSLKLPDSQKSVTDIITTTPSESDSRWFGHKGRQPERQYKNTDKLSGHPNR